MTGWRMNGAYRLRCFAVLGVLLVSTEFALGQGPAGAGGSQTAGKPSSKPGVARSSYTPPTGGERAKWMLVSSWGPVSLLTGAVSSGWNTTFNSPADWRVTWEGFGKRFGTRQVEVTMSSMVEAGFGAMWGEDPRYIRAAEGGFWARTGRTMSMTFLAHRGAGGRMPAVARYTAYLSSNSLSNAWRPGNDNNWNDALRRTGWTFLGRFTSNFFSEFGPDVRRKLFGRSHGEHEKYLARARALILAPASTSTSPNPE